MKSTDFEDRLKRLEDIQEIKDLHREYMFEVNNREWDRVIDRFSDDCSANIGRWGLRKGKESLQKLFKVDIAGNNKGKGRDGHFAIQPVIKVDEDKAEALADVCHDLGPGDRKRKKMESRSTRREICPGQRPMENSVHRFHQPLAKRGGFIPHSGGRLKQARLSREANSEVPAFERNLTRTAPVHSVFLHPPY